MDLKKLTCGLIKIKIKINLWFYIIKIKRIVITYAIKE